MCIVGSIVVASEYKLLYIPIFKIIELNVQVNLLIYHWEEIVVEAMACISQK